MDKLNCAVYVYAGVTGQKRRIKFFTGQGDFSSDFNKALQIEKKNLEEVYKKIIDSSPNFPIILLRVERVPLGDVMETFRLMDITPGEAFSLMDTTLGETINPVQTKKQ